MGCKQSSTKSDRSGRSSKDVKYVVDDKQQRRGKDGQQQSNQPLLLVAAIDFGTTYSGCAYSSHHDFKQDPLKVCAKTWQGGTILSHKAPTCVLIEPDGKTFAAFGYEAQDRYSDLTEKDDHRRWYYFEKFKMMLFGRIGLQRNVMLEDITGKKLPAMDVFSVAIEYLKNITVKMCKDSASGIVFDDIHWVITVPAIWNDAAKQFMREAAMKADIPDSHLAIALEPEAASLCCRHLPVEMMTGDGSISLSVFRPGAKYLVLDAGGGTVDINVHEVTGDGELHELYVPNGGNWGGNKVDEAFEQFFIAFVGHEVWNVFKNEHSEDYIDLLRNFEIKKRKTGEKSSDENERITLRIPAIIGDVFRKETSFSLQQKINNSEHKDKISYNGDKMRIDSTIVKAFFKKPIDNIVSHLQSLIKEPGVSDVSTIAMVGGFSQSPLLQSAIKNAFPSKRVIIPKEASQAVLIGAVIFGHSSSIITSRVCRCTYGVRYPIPFQDGVHPEYKRIHDAKGKSRCKDGFSVHVRRGQSVRLGEYEKEQIYHPLKASQNHVSFDICASENERPILATEQGCYALGTVEIYIPDLSGDLSRKIGLRMCFSATEIKVEAENKETRDVCTTIVNFLG